MHKGRYGLNINPPLAPEHTGANVTFFLPPPAPYFCGIFNKTKHRSIIPSQIKHIDPTLQIAPHFQVNINQKITIKRLAFLQIGESY